MKGKSALWVFVVVGVPSITSSADETQQTEWTDGSEAGIKTGNVNYVT